MLTTPFWRLLGGSDVGGVNRTAIVQLAPGARLVCLNIGRGLIVPHVVCSPPVSKPVGTVKFAEFDVIVGLVIPVSVAFPVFVRVKMNSGVPKMFVPRTTVPKLCE